MLKAIFAKHVLSGDIVLVSGGSRITVKLVELIGDSVHLYAAEGGIRVLREYDIVGLGHRASPKSEGQRWNSVINHAREVVERMGTEKVGRPNFVEREVAWLSEAIEEYELGLESTQQSAPDDDMDPRVDESCGFLGGGFAVR